MVAVSLKLQKEHAIVKEIFMIALVNVVVLPFWIVMMNVKVLPS